MHKLYAIILLVIATSCGSTSSSPESTEASETMKPSISFETVTLALTDLTVAEETWENEAYEITLNVDLTKNNYNGKSGCNSFFGTVERVGDGQLKFGMAGVTEMMCEEGIMHWEARYLNALTDKVFQVFEQKNTVLLKDDQQNTVLTFTKTEP